MRLRRLWLATVFTACVLTVNFPIHAKRPATRLDLSAALATGLPFCPPGGAGELRPSDTTGHHRVILSWNPALPVKDSPVGYCLYRSRKKGAAKKNAVCKDCELVNRVPVVDTSCVDDLVQDGAEYYYVVVAITNSGNASSSSNETPASIPATKQALSPDTTSHSAFCRGAASP